jgi:outer membrane protein assembly factor BamB
VPRIAWRAKVGTGFASFAVARGRVYTLGSSGGKDTVFCFDAATGKELWKHSYECALVDNLHEGGPAATPTVDGDFVYTLSKQGHLFRLAATTGAVEWKVELQGLLRVKMPEWGFSGSPLIVGELLILDAGPLVAFDKVTGFVRWRSTKSYKAGYGTAVPFSLGERKLLASLNNEGLLVVELETGKDHAFHEWKTPYDTSAATPIIDGDRIYISTGYGAGCALLRVTATRLEEIYRNKNMRNHMNVCVLEGTHLYGFDRNADEGRRLALVCQRFDDGEVAWRQTGLGCGSLMVADGKLIILSDRGELVIAEANAKEYREISRRKVLEGRCWTVPVLADGHIYCRNAAGDVVCVDVREKG